MVASCLIWPLTVSLMGRSCGSATASAERMHGPIGQNVSCHLPCIQSKNLSRSRGLRPGLGLKLAVADVVDDRVAGDVLERLGLGHAAAVAADHHAELALPVDLVGRDVGDHDRVAGMGQRRARRLHEDVGERLLPLGGRPPALGDVLGVVAGQEQELRRAGDRHQELDVVEGDRQ